MTHPRFSRRSRRADDDQAATELLQAIRPDDYDGTTVVFGGAAVVGLDPDQVYRQGDAGGDYAPPGRLRAQPEPHPPVRHDDDAIARDMTRGWEHLFEVRCAYPAFAGEWHLDAPGRWAWPVASDTPIPCGRTHRDAAAWTFRGLRTSAWAAGWHLDALGRWACPDCCQASPGYRTLYPVTVWDEQAAVARMGDDPHAERHFRAIAEHDLFRSVRDAAAKHAGSPR